MSGQDDDSDKSFDPTPQKLEKARKKGEIAKSNDLSVVAAYTGLLIALLLAGQYIAQRLGSALVVLIDQSDQIAAMITTGPAASPVAGLLQATIVPVAALFALPAAAVLLSLIAQRALVFAPDKLVPKPSRLSIISNAKNKCNYPATPLTEFNMTFFADEVVERCIGKNQPKSSWDRPEMSERRIAEFQKFGVTDCIET